MICSGVVNVMLIIREIFKPFLLLTKIFIMQRASQLLPVLAIFVSVFLPLSSFSQGVGINAGGNPPHPSAMLDISGNNSGVLINRMTESERDAISNPAEGLLV